MKLLKIQTHHHYALIKTKIENMTHLIDQHKKTKKFDHHLLGMRMCMCC